MTGRAGSSQGVAGPGLLRASTRPRTPAAQSVPLLIAVVLLIAGIVGMHVLSVGHHAPTASHAATGGDALVHGHEGHDPQSTHPHDETAAMSSGSEVAEIGCGPGCSDGLMSTGAPCMVALTLLLFLGRPRHLAQRVQGSQRRHPPAQLIALWANRPPPRAPSLTALCILRI